MTNQVMKPSVYLEATIVSYLTARPAKDVVLAAKLKVPQDWWNDRREDYDVFISDTVYSEISAGNPAAVQSRLELVLGVAKLGVTQDAEKLATILLQEIPLPVRAGADAMHLAIAAVNGLDYLLTWNCRHLANAHLRYRIEHLCHQEGFQPPMICTPLELMEP